MNHVLLLFAFGIISNIYISNCVNVHSIVENIFNCAGGGKISGLQGTFAQAKMWNSLQKSTKHLSKN